MSNAEIGDCTSCRRRNDEEDMVQCDKCKKWLHYSCAGVDATVDSRSWECVACTELNATVRNQSAAGERLDTARPPSITAIEVDRRSVASTARSRRNLKLELRRLDEQKLLDDRFLAREKKREQDYLRDKFEILALEEEADESEDNASVQNQRVADWANNLKPTADEDTEITENAARKNEKALAITHPAVVEPVPLDQRQIAARQVLAKELPLFSGNPEEWPLFISSYENTTKLCGFSDEENLWRLQRALKGSALRAVGSRLMLPSAVTEVISELRMLYGQPSYILQTMLKKIRAEPPPKADRLETIIQYALSVRSLKCTMEASGLYNHLNDPTLLQELIDKLPAPIRLNWAIDKGAKEHNLTQFSDWLYKIAKAASSVTTFAAVDGRNERRHQAQLHTHTEGRITTTANQSNQPKGKCFLCDREHKLVECERFRQLTVRQKWELVRSRGVCEGCLGHPKRFRCRSGRPCGVNRCESRHHPLLHYHQETLPQEPAVSGNYHAHQQGADTLFSIVPVVLHGNGVSLETFAFLDNGSSLTLVEEDIAKNLGLDGVSKPLCLKWTSNTTRFEEDSKVVPLQIGTRSGGDNQQRYWLRDVRTIKKLALPVQSVDMRVMGSKYTHLCGLPMQSYKDAQCGILIGINNQRLLLAQQTREGKWNDPVAIRTRLGWCVSGSNIGDANDNGLYHVYEECECNKDLHEMVRKHYILEDHGTEKVIIESAEDVRAKGILSATVKKNGNAFCSGLLWRYDDIVLPESFAMALKRLRCLEKKISLDDSLRSMVGGQINDLVAKGYARKLSQKEIDDFHPRCWYLPTFLVRNPNKPGKVRLVWDAAAFAHGVSLNKMLLKGPDELRVLTDVLYGFRMRRVAIAGDIEEMFHQVGVTEEDQHSQRFLWRDGDSSRRPDVYVMQVLTFGASCSPSIAQYVKNTNAREFANTLPRASEAIIQHHYVDDLLDSVDSIEDAIRLAKEVRHIHSKAGFNIRNWLSNSKEVLHALHQPEGNGKKFQESPQEICATKVLGLWWNTTDDIFTFSLKFTKGHEEVLKGRRIPTKRELLRVLMSIYDPLGFLAFYLVKLKVLLQEVWKSASDWDETIDHNLQDEWEAWRVMLPKVEDVRIPRCYLPNGFNSQALVQLHVFVDASEDAMAAVVYLRYEDGGSVDCVIVSAKCKVAPLKPLSIPRLELQAALIGARLANTITKSHAGIINRRFFWTDSRNVLSWLRADAKRFKPFVMFRVGEILELTEKDEWKWVPTKLNVADLATKWTKIPTFHPSSRWFKGPEFLYDPIETWPGQPNLVEKQMEELRPQFLLLHNTIANEAVIDVSRFSSWRRLGRAMAYVFRFINNTRGRCSGLELTKEVLLSEEIQQAEIFLLQLAQMDTFADEIAMLKNNDMLPKTSQLFKLSPYLDNDGLLRIKGRIDGAWCVEEMTKRPVIMPKKHHITFLIVNEYHNRFHHRCQETVVNEVRQKFWVPSLRTLVRTVRGRCQKCRNSKAAPAPPEMAPLPEARLAAYIRPFSYTGIDYFGPILIISGRKTEKRWGVLFTCLTIRAIHIEVANSLSADSCIMCLRNFMSRRGTPREIYSDNGTNLKGAEKELRDAYHQMNQGVVRNTFISADTKWYFNPPAAPHMGGCWERLIGSVKGVLKEITRNQRLEDESLRSLLVEVEGIINSRPLTHVSVDAEDAEALTPNHFLLGSSSGVKPPGDFNDRDILRKSWRVVQQLSNHFWRRWIREYLPTLTRRTKWFQPVKNVEIGDVVIIVDENHTRSTWPRGIVVDTIRGRDGQTRRATVRTSTGFYDRPVVKLAVLDVSNEGICDAAADVPASPGGGNVADSRVRLSAERSPTHPLC